MLPTVLPLFVRRRDTRIRRSGDTRIALVEPGLVRVRVEQTDPLLARPRAAADAGRPVQSGSSDADEEPAGAGDRACPGASAVVPPSSLRKRFFQVAEDGGGHSVVPKRAGAIMAIRDSCGKMAVLALQEVSKPVEHIFGAIREGGKDVDPLAGRTAVLFDPFPLWLDAVERVVVSAGLEVPGKTTDLDATPTLIDECEPDVLVTEIPVNDTEMPGALWIRTTVAHRPAMKAIVFSSVDDPAERSAAFAAGASAYVLKSAHPKDVAVAVRQVFEHSISFAHNVDWTIEPASTTAAATCDLTPREREILQLVAEGHSNSKLASMLWVTEQTVKFHLSNIYRKLDVANRTEASRWAQLNDLLPPTPVAPRQAA